jgi:hypothetical protein
MSTASFAASAPDVGTIRFFRDRDMGQVIRITFRFLAEHLREIGGGIATIAGPAYLMVAVFGAFADPNNPGHQMAVSFAGILPGLLLTGSVLGYVRLYRQGLEGSITVPDLWEEAKLWILPILGYQMLVGLAVVLVLALILGVGISGGTATTIVAGLVVLAGAVWVMPIVLVGLIVKVVEEEGTIDSVMRAVELVRSRRGVAYGASIVLALMMVFLFIVIGGMAGSVLFFATDPENPSPLALGLSSALSYAVVMVGSTIYTLASAFLHGALVESVEGTTLMDEISDLASGEPVHREPAFREPVAEPDEVMQVDPSVPAPTSPVETDSSEPLRTGFRGGGFDGPAS